MEWHEKFLVSRESMGYGRRKEHVGLQGVVPTGAGLSHSSGRRGGVRGRAPATSNNQRQKNALPAMACRLEGSIIVVSTNHRG